MRSLCVFVVAVLLVTPLLAQQDASYGDDNNSDDFAEFEDFEEDDFEPAAKQDSKETGGGRGSKAGEAVDASFANIYDNDEADDDGVVEEEDNEFEHFKDEEEFEGFAKGEQPPPVDQKTGDIKLTMAQVPLHFR